MSLIKKNRFFRVFLAIFTNSIGFFLVFAGVCNLIWEIPDDFGNPIETFWALDLIFFVAGLAFLRCTYRILLVDLEDSKLR